MSLANLVECWTIDWVVLTLVRVVGLTSFSGLLESALVGGLTPFFGGFGVLIRVSGTKRTISITILAPYIVRNHCVDLHPNLCPREPPMMGENNGPSKGPR